VRTAAAIVALVVVIAGLGEERAMSQPAGLAAKLAAVRDRSTCRITTRGRKSGKPHTVTIWFIAEGTTLYLGTLNARRDWVLNLGKNPDVTIDVEGLRVTGRATAITDPAAEAHVRELLAQKYWMAWIGSWFGKGPERTFRVEGVQIA
jgi:deazaflavin-dependent oxidoreductase (nitroreductase family)